MGRAGGDRCPPPPARTLDGLLIYRFGSSLYFANAHTLQREIRAFLDDGRPLDWLCLDSPAIGDVDHSAPGRPSGTSTTNSAPAASGSRSPTFPDQVWRELDRYGIHATASQALDAYRKIRPAGADQAPAT